MPTENAEEIRRAELLRLHAEVFGLSLPVAGGVAKRIALTALIANHVGQRIDGVDSDGPLRDGLRRAIKRIQVASDLAIAVGLDRRQAFPQRASDQVAM